MTDHQFSTAFKDIVPEPPGPQGWADGAKQRRRRRSGLFAGAAGLAVVALAIPIGMQLADPDLVATPADEPTIVATPEPASGDLLGAAACFDDDGQPVQPAEGAAAPEAGATRAWLCGDAFDTLSFGTVGPLEPLTTDVDQIVELIGAQPELPADAMCTMEYTLAYRVVLEYDDGTTRPVAGELHGCRTINDGSTMREGGQELYDLALDLWRAQRADSDAPEAPPVQPPCPLSAVMLTPSLDEVVGGIACVPGEDPTVLERVELTPEAVSAIVDDIRANAAPGEADGWEDGFALTGAWGDWLRLVRTADGSGYWFTDVDGTHMVWTPSPEVQETLTDALGDGQGTDGAPVNPIDEPIEQPVESPTDR